MRHLYFFIFLLAMFTTARAQDFDKNLASAKSSYASGDLSNARFAMEQLLGDLDIAIGKEIMKLLPTTIGTMAYSVKDDNVTGGSGAATGLFVHRSYAKAERLAKIDIINNSPLMTSISAILNTPLIGGMMRNENQKVVKVQGYKSLLQKSTDGDKTNYELQIPFNNTLLTFHVDDTNEAEITKFAATLPLAKIAQVSQ